MATNDLKSKVLKQVLNVDLKDEKSKENLLDSELDEVSGGVSKNETISSESAQEGSCKCGLLLAMS